MDRTGPETLQNATKPHFGVILTHFGLGLADSPCSFRDFLEPQYGQKRPKWTQFDQKWLSKGPYVQVKCWQSVFLGTKMLFASLCHGLFLFWNAGVGGRLSSVGFWRLPACVQCRFTANRTGLWCSAQCIHGLADYFFGGESPAEKAG